MKPPHDADMEAAVAGTLLMDERVHSTVLDHLTDDDFFTVPARSVVAAVRAMVAAGETVDALSVAHVCDDDLRPWILTAQNRALLVSEVSGHVTRLKHLSESRAVLTAAMTMASRAERAEDAESVLSDALRELTERTALGTRAAESVQSLVRRRLAEAQQPRDFLTVDGLEGLHISRGDLVVIGARPGAGKTAFALHLCDEWAMTQRVAFYSYEMSAEQIADRIISRHSGLSVEDIECGLSASDAALVGDFVTEGVGARNLFVKVAAGMTGMELFASLRRFAAGGGRVAVVDYIQLACDRSRHGLTHDVTTFTNTLKRVALDTGLSVVALSQLNRASAERGAVKVPILTDLRDSGSVEQDANTVLLMLALPSLRRDEGALAWAQRALVGYGFSPSALEVGDDPDDDRRLVFVEAAKVRQGRMRRRPYVFDGATMRFEVVR